LSAMFRLPCFKGLNVTRLEKFHGTEL
jgi:hypothetical protein